MKTEPQIVAIARALAEHWGWKCPDQEYGEHEELTRWANRAAADVMCVLEPARTLAIMRRPAMYVGEQGYRDMDDWQLDAVFAVFSATDVVQMA
jgi:hypothetical protein